MTRYVDHERSTRGGSGVEEARFLSSQFGSGAQMKARAVEMLTTDDGLKSFLAQPFRVDNNNDVASILARPFTPSRG